MKKEFGKWLLDIAKYITTAVVLSSVFGEINSISMYIVGSCSVILILICGLLLVADKPIKLSLRKNRNNNLSQS